MIRYCAAIGAVRAMRSRAFHIPEYIMYVSSFAAKAVLEQRLVEINKCDIHDSVHGCFDNAVIATLIVAQW